MTDQNAPLKEPWISASHIQHFIARAEAMGIDVAPWLRHAGLNREQLDNADATVPAKLLEDALEQLSEQYPETAIGLELATDVQAATFGVLGLLSQSCARFHEVLDLVTRYNGLLSNIGHTRIHHHPGRVDVEWCCLAGGPHLQRHACDYVLGSFVVLARALLPHGYHLPIEASFPGPKPDSPNQLNHYQALFQCPVNFEQSRAVLTIDKAVLQAPMRHSNIQIRKMLEEHASDLLRRRQTHLSVCDTAKQLIIASLGERVPDKAQIARQMGMSARTLHRKLQEEGTRFQALLNQTRIHEAREQLSDNTRELASVSSALGFQSRQSFMRWFKQQTGITPGQYRLSLKRHQQQD